MSSAFEQRAKKALEDSGYRIMTRGWPDFLVVDASGTLAFVVELKTGADKVRPEQKAVHELLRAAGLKVYVIHEMEFDLFREAIGGAGERRIPLAPTVPPQSEDDGPYDGLGSYRDRVLSYLRLAGDDDAQVVEK